MTPRSPSKLGSLPQQVQSSSPFGCFVAGVCTPLHATVHGREVQSARFHCGAPMGAGSVAAYHLWCTPCAWDRGFCLDAGLLGSGGGGGGREGSEKANRLSCVVEGGRKPSLCVFCVSGCG